MLLRKPNDIKCLGCREDKISSTNPKINENILKIYYHYMCERNKIYQRKELSKQNAPWTNDPILMNNSFTCVKRWLDRTSKYLVENISHNTNLSYEDRVWRTILFRLYNKIETAELIGISSSNFWYSGNIDIAMQKLDNYPNDSFTRAYKVIRPKYAYRDQSPAGHDNWKSSLLWYIASVEDSYSDGDKISIPNELEKDAQSALNWIKNNIDGVGNFIAYQIFVDLTYIPEYPISEEEFVVSGPGCHAGLEFLFEDMDGMTDEETLFWLRDKIDGLFEKVSDGVYDVCDFFWYLDPEDRKWTVMDLENSFCELSKYIYISEGRHKRPRKYMYHD